MGLGEIDIGSNQRIYWGGCWPDVLNPSGNTESLTGLDKVYKPVASTSPGAMVK